MFVSRKNLYICKTQTNKYIMKSKINCQNYSEKTVLQLLKSIPKYNVIIANAKEWEEVGKYLDENFILNDNQIEFVKSKQFN